MGYPVLISLLAALLGLAFVLYTARNVLAAETGNERMNEIARAIQEGATAFLNSEYRVLSIFVVVVTVLVAATLGLYTAIAFVAGALLSALAGNIGMNIAVRANVRTAAAAAKSLNTLPPTLYGSELPVYASRYSTK